MVTLQRTFQYATSLQIHADVCNWLSIKDDAGFAIAPDGYRLFPGQMSLLILNFEMFSNCGSEDDWARCLCTLS